MRVCPSIQQDLLRAFLRVESLEDGEWGAEDVEFGVLVMLFVELLSHVRLFVTPWTVARQAPRPWNSPGKNSGVGCHFLLQCMKVKNESEVAQFCLTLSDPMDCSLPGSSVHGGFQARVLEWGAIPFSRGSSRSRNRTFVSYIGRQILFH